MSYTNLNYTYRRLPIISPAQLMADRDIFHPTSDQKFMLGCLLKMDNGDRFRYCKDSGTGITKARMSQAAGPPATLIDEAQTSYAKAVGNVKFDCLVTTGSSLADHDLIDGWMLCNTGTSIGDLYLIKDNKWTTSDTVLNIEIADTGGLRTIIATTDTLTFIKNKYRDVLVAPTTQTAQAIGVPLVTVTAGYYFWAKTRGPAPILVDTGGALVIGDPCGQPHTWDIAGACDLWTDTVERMWGTVMSVEAAAGVALVDLCLE